MDSLLNYSLKGLEAVCEGYGQPKYRAKQLYIWLQSGVGYDGMSNLPKGFIEKLKADYTAEGVKIEQKLVSRDGTVKYLYLLSDGNIIEGVLMRYKYGNTLCVSTQVGCRMNCAFCASGLDGLIRNLTPAEILGQVIAVNADEGFSVTLTLSLHAPDNELRSSLMPVNNAYPIEDVIDAAKYYFDKTGRRIIFEYALIKGKNDTPECADKLYRLLKGLPCHINLIRLNYVKEKGLRASDAASDFLKKLEEYKLSATVRRTMGSDIEGACGQLRRRYLK